MNKTQIMVNRKDGSTVPLMDVLRDMKKLMEEFQDYLQTIQSDTKE